MNKTRFLTLSALFLSACLSTDDGDGDSRDGSEPDAVTSLPGGGFFDAGADGGPVVIEPGGTVDLGTCSATSLGSQLPVRVSGDTSRETDLLGDELCGGESQRAPDALFAWQAPRAGVYTFATSGASYDTLLFVLQSCAGPELACNDDAAADRSSRVQVEVAAGQVLLIAVSGWGGEMGTFELTVEGTESMCDDRVDDDNDGLVDCDDPDCRTEECVFDGAWPEEWSALEEEMLEILNQNRARGANCGGTQYDPVPPLEMDEIARISARLHSQDMGARNFFDHDTPDGVQFFERMDAAGFEGLEPWGENLAGGSATAAGAMSGLMNSPGHCVNIMRPEFRVVGIGYAYDAESDFGHYWTQNFGASH